MLIEKGQLGGVCLNVGCIPSKSLIDISEKYHELNHLKDRGILLDSPSLDPASISGYVKSGVNRLTSGVRQLLKLSDVEIVEGEASFTAPNEIRVVGPHESFRVVFKQAILATGSKARDLPNLLVDHKRIVDSSDLLFPQEIPESMLIVGGGYIGVELGACYARLGSAVTIVEALPQLLTGIDTDAARFVVKGLERLAVKILTGTQVHEVVSSGDKLIVKLRTQSSTDELTVSKLAVVAGREPVLSTNLGLSKAGIEINSTGRIIVDDTMRTSNPDVFACGDITPGPMLAHKAYYEAMVAVGAACGLPVGNDAQVIPAVIFGEPEIAIAGPSEQAARDMYGDDLEIARFPYSANGKAVAVGAIDGMVKLMFRSSNRIVVGCTIVGKDASNLISEAVLAIEMGATLEDVALTIHPHPSFSEMIAEAAEVALGTPLHVFIQKPKNPA
jgi:dihydrolipoamide dehydrogenase